MTCDFCRNHNRIQHCLFKFNGHFNKSNFACPLIKKLKDLAEMYGIIANSHDSGAIYIIPVSGGYIMAYNVIDGNRFDALKYVSKGKVKNIKQNKLQYLIRMKYNL